MKNNVKMRTIS